MKKKVLLLSLIFAGLGHAGFLRVYAAPIAAGLSARAMVAISITGSVVDEDGLALPGVTVTVKGTKIATVTDGNGYFRISVPNSTSVLVFSAIGQKTQEKTVGQQTVFNIKLIGERSALNEVVVVGYGTQRVRHLTTSVGSIKSTEIEKYNVPSFTTALVGQIPGLQMNESSGVPGAAVNIRIRGINTVNGSAGPLYIVDGVPIITSGGGDGDASYTNGLTVGVQSNPLADINPNDIASIEVLKDAAATAIYGARGSGGVILITTKRAQPGKTSFTLRLNNGYSRVGKQVQFLNGPQLLTVMDEAYRNTFYSNPANANLPVPATPLVGILNFDRGMADTTNINHLAEILRTGQYQEVNISGSSGTQKTKFLTSGLFRRTLATFKGQDLNQYSFRITVDHDLSKYVRIGAMVSPSYSVENRLGSGTAATVGGYGAAVTANVPIYPIYNADGTYFNAWNNPLAFRDRSLFSDKQRRLNTTMQAYVDARLLTNLSWRTNLQRQDISNVANTYTAGLLRLRTTNSATISPFPDDQLARVAQQNSYGYANSLESYFTYNKTFARKHVVNAVLGMRFNKMDTFYEAMYGENFANENLTYPSQAASVEAAWQTGALGDPSANLGYFFRVNYNYRERYLFSVTVNRDGSSRFGSAKRYGTFPAVSAGWIISDEGFLKNNKTLTFLKLRGSFGLTGNAQGISNTAAQSTWSTGTGGYINYPTNIPNMPANANLRWEKGVKYDAGLDIGLWNDRINITTDAYYYTTNDMLLSVPTPFTFGYGNSSSVISYLENRGSMINKGLEFGITSNNINGKFRWQTNFNISRNIGHVVSIGGLTPEQLSAGGTAGNVLLYEGHQGPVFNVIEWVGVDPATGGELVRNKDGAVVLASTLNAQQLADARRPQYDKLPAPKFYGGFGNNFSYKNFGLSAFFAYSYGNYMLDAGTRASSYVANYSIPNSGSIINIGNVTLDALKRWTTPGQITDFPRVFYADATNDNLRTLNTSRFLYDASYIRLKNISLTYKLSQKAATKLGLKSLVFNATGQNLLLFTKFKGPDPEAQNIGNTNRERNLAYGLITNVLPQPKQITFGLNANF